VIPAAAAAPPGQTAKRPRLTDASNGQEEQSQSSSGLSQLVAVMEESDAASSAAPMATDAAVGEAVTKSIVSAVERLCAEHNVQPQIAAYALWTSEGDPVKAGLLIKRRIGALTC
jgi:hypothetical protein